MGVLCVISFSGKPHLKPAFCFLNMDLIPSLMIYDKEDQCRLQVKVMCVSECVCVWAGGRAHTFVHILLCTHECGCLCVCLCVCALSLMGTCCRTSQRREPLLDMLHLAGQRG